MLIKLNFVYLPSNHVLIVCTTIKVKEHIIHDIFNFEKHLHYIEVEIDNIDNNVPTKIKYLRNVDESFELYSINHFSNVIVFQKQLFLTLCWN